MMNRCGHKQGCPTLNASDVQFWTLGMECWPWSSFMSPSAGHRHAHVSILPWATFPPTRPHPSTNPNTCVHTLSETFNCSSAHTLPMSTPQGSPLSQGLPGSQEAPVGRADQSHLGIPVQGCSPHRGHSGQTFPPNLCPLSSSTSSCLSYLSLSVLPIFSCLTISLSTSVSVSHSSSGSHSFCLSPSFHISRLSVWFSLSVSLFLSLSLSLLLSLPLCLCLSLCLSVSASVSLRVSAARLSYSQ